MSLEYKNPSFHAQTIVQSLNQGTYKVSDLQWRFAVTAKHSLVVDHTQCLIQLKLELQSTQGKDRKVVHLQLSMEEFNELFREMEKVANMLSIIH